MKDLKQFLIIAILFLGFQDALGQDSKYLHYLVDSLPKGKPVLVNLEVEKNFMATERVEISKNGKTLFYGARNGYKTTSKADILKIEFNKGKWNKPQVVFADSSGAPSLSKDEKTIYFQYDHQLSPKGLYSRKTKTGWSTPKRFLDSLEKSHYLQSPKKSSFYYSSGIKGNDKIQNIFHVVTTKSDTLIKQLGFKVKGDFIDFYVSPDESFLILVMNKATNEDSFAFYAKSDLFISFKKDSKTWTKPVNLGAETHSVSEWNWGPYVTNDKKYLFFSSWGKTVGTYMIDFEPIYSRLKLKSN
ncbi:hypothetical protein [Flavivirga algicola]|uniref:WD40 repeat protein n=1 Tax=Flavivirga algicola TaxID=2729136 RepID=A0ABX1RYA7_9FLAO|nr:hypothetical protein [Flavivirga algicola]NMH88028.1 hypothetical protein [Flavivirga algicola]